jgi:hypothetical protein
MDTLHTVLRSISRERKGETTQKQHEPLTVFREFLLHLDRAQKRNAAGKSVKLSTKRRVKRKR